METFLSFRQAALCVLFTEQPTTLVAYSMIQMVLQRDIIHRECSFHERSNTEEFLKYTNKLYGRIGQRNFVKRLTRLPTIWKEDLDLPFYMRANLFPARRR